MQCEVYLDLHQKAPKGVSLLRNLTQVFRSFETSQFVRKNASYNLMSGPGGFMMIYSGMDSVFVLSLIRQAQTLLAGGLTRRRGPRWKWGCAGHSCFSVHVHP